MKTMKNNKSMSMILSIILLMSTTFSLQAQESESLKRDMEVTSNLLSTLLRTNTGNSIMRVGTYEIETSYNEGFGVVFELKGADIVFLNSAQYLSLNSPNEVKVNLDVQTVEEESMNKAVSVGSNRNLSGVAYSPRVSGARSFWSTNGEEQGVKLEESIKEFLIEYGSFLKDMKPDEKIMVQYPFVKADAEQNKEGNEIRILNFFSNPKATKSFQIEKKDADAYRNGSITKEEALSRITVEENLPEEVATDLRVLGELMNSLYSERNSKTYFSTTNPTIVKTKGMGAIYSWAVYSAYNDSFGYRLPTLSMGAETVDEKNRNELVKAAYPNFLKSFKENLVDYGRTVKSLEGNEKIVFNIRMTKCDGCGIPNMLKVEMDRATIEDYNQGKLSRSQAITKLKVIEN